MPVERVVMLTAVVLWAAVSFASRLWGAILGVVLAIGVGVWGWHTMGTGAQLSVMGLQRPLTAPAFYTFVSMLVVVNGLVAVHCWRERRRTSDAAAH